MKKTLTDTTELSFAPDPTRPGAFLDLCPAYETTPLKTLTLESGIDVFAKDETNRMNLGAFKALGGPYAVARLIQQLWQQQHSDALPLSRLLDDDIKTFAKQIVFVCASAGNHGIGVATGARLFNARARIYLARTVPQGFSQRLSDHGAEVVIAGKNYEESMAKSIEDAENTGAILLSDGSWPGYTQIPGLVMEGYTVIAEELRRHFESNNQWPSHVYLQAGVGGLAAAIAYMIRYNWAKQPQIIVVEPDNAACLKSSHLAGRCIRVQGEESNMGRLDCKNPSIVAWDTLEKCQVSYETVTDVQATEAAQQVTQFGIPTTPSGAAGFAALIQNDYKLNPSYRPLIIISERPE